MDNRAYVLAAISTVVLLSFKGWLQRRWARSITHEQARLSFDMGVDVWLLLSALAIMGLGVVSIYSASFIRSGRSMQNPDYFVNQQLLFMCVGLGVIWVTSKLNYNLWRELSAPFWLLALLMLALVPFAGRSAKGAARWLDLGFFNIQPVEVMKVALLLFCCRLICERRVKPSQTMGELILSYLPFGLVLLMPCGLLWAQPDFGSIVILAGIAMVIFVLAGGALKLIGVGITFVSLAGVGMYLSGSRHIHDRLVKFWEMRSLTASSSTDDNYNIVQGIIGFGSGKLSGRGLGNSLQRNFFLPEAHTDFIFNIYGEETGLIGVCLLIALYLVIFERGLKIARRAPTPFGAFCASMISLLFFGQALINMTMSIGLLPAKGLTLPLMSYGGSSLLLVCFMLGILLNISRRPSPPSPSHPLTRLAQKLDVARFVSRSL